MYIYIHIYICIERYYRDRSTDRAEHHRSSSQGHTKALVLLEASRQLGLHEILGASARSYHVLQSQSAFRQYAGGSIPCFCPGVAGFELGGNQGPADGRCFGAQWGSPQGGDETDLGIFRWLTVQVLTLSHCAGGSRFWPSLLTWSQVSNQMKSRYSRRGVEREHVRAIQERGSRQDRVETLSDIQPRPRTCTTFLNRRSMP